MRRIWMREDARLRGERRVCVFGSTARTPLRFLSTHTFTLNRSTRPHCICRRRRWHPASDAL